MIRQSKDVGPHRSAYLALSRRDADRVGDHKRRHLLLDRNNVGKSDNDLHRRDQSLTNKVWTQGTHVGDPSKDIGMERQVVF
jgi:hypothetical protein